MNTMMLNKLIIEGISYRRTIEFYRGLTIISGEKTSGKSLVLSLIDYCLGRSNKIDLNVQRELDEHCDHVFLELTINNETITLNRHLKHKQSKMSIYFCPFEDIDGYTPKTVDQDELMQFLMRKLRLNEYKLLKHKKHSNEQALETVSFRDIFRFVYIHQHELGTHDFLSSKNTFKRYKNPHAFKMMFGLIDPDKDNLKQQLVDARNKIEETNKEIWGLKSYLKDKGAEEYTVLWNEHNRYLSEIDQRKHEKGLILQDSKNSKNSENEMYISLKNDLVENANEISKHQGHKNDYLLSINSKKLLIQEYENESEELEATIELNYRLEISQHKIECPLCNSIVPHESHASGEVNSVNTLHKIQRDLKNKITLVARMIDKDEAMIQELDTKISRLSTKREVLSNAVAEFTKETEVPFLSQIDSINTIISTLSKQQEGIKECLRIHRKVTEKEKQITDLEAEVARLEGELKGLNVSESYRTEVMDYLNEHYKSYMSRFKYDTKSETYIDSDSYIPYYRGSSVYEHESGGLLLCMQVAYLSAILTGKQKGYALGHPGILMLDSLSKYIGILRNVDGVEDTNPERELIHDPEVYEEIYKVITELCTDHQIIIVENTPPNIDVFYKKYTFLSGDKGLVNMAVNEVNQLH